MPRRVIERIEPHPLGPGGKPSVDVTARDIMGDQYGDPYTFTVRGAEAVQAIYDEAQSSP